MLHRIFERILRSWSDILEYACPFVTKRPGGYHSLWHFAQHTPQILMLKARSNIFEPNLGTNLQEIYHTTYLVHVQLCVCTFDHFLYFWKGFEMFWTQNCRMHCLMVVVGLMFDDNNGPQNFPILAHSINIYYWWPRYENIGSKHSAPSHCLYAWSLTFNI